MKKWILNSYENDIFIVDNIKYNLNEFIIN